MAKKNNYTPFMKDFYRISKERLRAHLDKLIEVEDCLKCLSAKTEEEKKSLNKAIVGLIDILNNLYGYKNYEDYLAGGEFIQDDWIGWSDFDEEKLFRIEFPDGIERDAGN